MLRTLLRHVLPPIYLVSSFFSSTSSILSTPAVFCLEVDQVIRRKGDGRSGQNATKEEEVRREEQPNDYTRIPNIAADHILSTRSFS